MNVCFWGGDGHKTILASFFQDISFFIRSSYSALLPTEPYIGRDASMALSSGTGVLNFCIIFATHELQ